MPKILTYNSPPDIEKKAGKESLFKSFWEKFQSSDKFTKFYILAFLLIVIATPFLVNNLLETRQRAAGPQNNINNPSALPQSSSVPDEILLRFKPGASDKVKNSTLSRYNLTEKEEIPHIGVKVIKVNPKARDRVIEALSHNPAVDFAEQNGIVKTQLIPNDYLYPYGQWGVQKVQAPAAWDITTGSSSVVIAMLDTGVYAAHPDLSAKMVAGYNFVGGNTDPNDDNGHGTATAGIAAASTNNSIGMAGMSWGSPIMPVKVCNSTGLCAWSAVASGLTWAADHGGGVINMSIAGVGSCPSTLQSAVDYAWNKGAVIVASSGNEGASTVDTPANCNHVVAVGATDATDTRTSWSTYGSALDLVAPGATITCTTLPGQSVTGYASCTGTSFSSPIVAGAAALLVSKGANNSTTVNALTAGADDLGTPGFDQYYGYGRLNAYKSLQTLTGITPPPVDTTAPTASISSPVSGQTVSGSISVSVSASDNVGVSKVELYRDGSLLGTGISSPYSFFWDSTTVGNGTHTLVAKAYDSAGNVGTSSTVSVTVSNSTDDTTAPTTSITSPVSGSTVSGATSISASASDNVGVTAVDFFVDGALLGEKTASPYTISWDTTSYVNGSHTIYSKAVDAAGNIGTSTTITVNVSNLVSPTYTPTPTVASSPTPIPTIPPTSDTTPPTVSISYPTSGQVLVRNSTITISASATDNVGVGRVEFYVNGSLTCTDTTTPYTCSWKVPGKPNTSYTISAKAYDTSGNTSTSAVSVIAGK